MQTFESDYIEALLWSSTDNTSDQGGEPLDKNYSRADIAPESISKIYKDCWEFKLKIAPLYQEFGPDIFEGDPHPGHDFWLTRNGHGSGFWDGDYLPPERGDKLTEIANSFGESNPYIGDDGLIYLLEG